MAKTFDTTSEVDTVESLMDFFKLFIVNWNSCWLLPELLNCRLGMTLAKNSVGFNFPLSTASNSYFLCVKKFNENKNKNDVIHMLKGNHDKFKPSRSFCSPFWRSLFEYLFPFLYLCVYIVIRSTDKRKPNLYARLYILNVKILKCQWERDIWKCQTAREWIHELTHLKLLASLCSML